MHAFLLHFHSSANQIQVVKYPILSDHGPNPRFLLPSWNVSKRLVTKSPLPFNGKLFLSVCRTVISLVLLKQVRHSRQVFFSFQSLTIFVGSGKTAAFVIPMLAFISNLPPFTDDNRHLGPYALILAPTRELAQQIESEAKKFASPLGYKCVSIVGGVGVISFSTGGES